MGTQSKIGVLLPRESMLEQIEKVLSQEKEWREDILDIRITKTSDCLEEARKLIDRGARVIVARGLQAEILKKNTNIPVVEIVTTTQEIGIMINNAKKQIRKKCPKIAMVTFKSSIGDVTYINEIFDVRFSVYIADSVEELELLVRQAAEEGADIIIGGEKVGRVVKHYNIPCLFAVSTEDSIRNALDIARKMSYTADVERSYNAQVETILDSTFNGVVRIDRNKKIAFINRMMEDLLQKKSPAVEGKSIESVISVEGDYIDRVLAGKQESCLTSAKVRDLPIMIMIAPIRVDDDINGAIVSCHKLKNIVNQRTRTSQEMYLSGYFARGEFDQISGRDKCTKNTIELAKKYALSRFPVLICGEDEAEAKLYAQSIHNNSLRKNSPFVSVSCAHFTPEEQLKVFFGDGDSDGDSNAEAGMEKQGLLNTAKYGTIFIRNIEQLGPACQYKLFRIISNRSDQHSDADRIPHCDVRLIAGTDKNLKKFVEGGQFRRDLYYAISALTLNIPPLSGRPDDIETLAELYLENFKETYSRYLTISVDGMQELRKYSWPGGVVQLEAFCERMFLSSTKKTITGSFVQELLREVYPADLYPEIRNRQPLLSDVQYPENILSETASAAGVHRENEAVQIETLLHKYAGNRQRVAKELGISTTTLWRRMKKFGLIE